MDLSEKEIKIIQAWIIDNQVDFYKWLELNGMDVTKVDPSMVIMLAFRYDPVLFIEMVCGTKLQEWQKKFMYAVRDNQQVSVRSGTGIGKSTAVALLTIWWVFTHNIDNAGCMVACLSVSEKQIKSGIWKEVGIWYTKMKPWAKELLEYQGERLFQKANQKNAYAEVRVANAETPETLAGMHSNNMLVICDEASGFSNATFDILDGAMTTENAKMILISNPRSNNGLFYDTHRNPNIKKLWVTFHIPAKPEYSDRITQKWVDNQLAKCGGDIDDSEYRIKILGEFPEVEDMVVVSRILAEKAIKSQSIETDGMFIYWGLDPARSEGGDRTALAKRRGNTLLEPIQTWKTGDSTVTINRIYREYHDAKPADKPATIFIELDGLGAPIYDQLINMGLPVSGIRSGGGPKDKTKYINKRAEMWFNLRDWFKAKNRKFVVKQHSDIEQYEQLVNELSCVKYQYTGTGKIKIESKDEIKKRLKWSTDLADALGLTLFGDDSNKYNYEDVDIDYSYIMDSPHCFK